MVTIVSRAEWGARPPVADPTSAPIEGRDSFFVHYTTGQELGREDTAQWVRGIQAYHQDGRGWNDIGYNFLIDREGRIFEGRGWDVVGAHCTGWNTRAYGVAFLGNDDPDPVQDVPEVARVSFKALYDEACRRSGRDLTRFGHRDHAATQCPGDELYAWVHAGMPLVEPSPLPSGDVVSEQPPTDQQWREVIKTWMTVEGAAWHQIAPLPIPPPEPEPPTPVPPLPEPEPIPVPPIPPEPTPVPCDIDLAGDVWIGLLTYGTNDSDSVRRMQKVLNSVSLPPPGNVTIDLCPGRYGPQTDAVVRTWQDVKTNDAPDPVGASSIGPRQAALLFAGTPCVLRPGVPGGSPYAGYVPIARARTTFEVGMCLRYVRQVYGIAAKYDDADEAWRNVNARHAGDRAAPAGAPVWYTGGFGHVAVSLGGGRIWSTDYPSPGRCGETDLDWPTRQWGHPYAGWSEDVNEVQIPLKPA